MQTELNMKRGGAFDLDSALQWFLILTRKRRYNCTILKLQAYSSYQRQVLDVVATRLGFRMYYQPEHTLRIPQQLASSWVMQEYPMSSLLWDSIPC